MLHVEIRVASAGSEVDRVTENAAGSIRAEGLVGDVGDIVDGVGPRIVQIELQPVRHLLVQGGQQPVVIGVAFVGDVETGTKLRIQSYAGGDDSSNRSINDVEHLDRVGQVAACR